MSDGTPLEQAMAAESEPTRASKRAEQGTPAAASVAGDVPLLTRDLSCYYGKHHAVDSVTLEFRENMVTALIGPSGCGKSTYLRSLNRMHELVPNAYNTGEAILRGTNIFGRDADPVAIRRAIGMVFQRPNPFPTKSIADNILAGPQVQPRQAVAVGARRPGRADAARRRRSGTRSRAGSTRPPAACPAVSSSGCASPAPWPWSPRCC